jgi:hypothetical protein
VPVTAPGASYGPNHRLFDFNGDGRTDFLIVNQDVGQGMTVAQSTGRRFLAVSSFAPRGLPANGNAGNRRIFMCPTIDPATG